MEIQTKLSNTILKSVSIRVLLVILITSVISYLHLYNTTEKNIKETLQKYVSERTKREESLFLLAESNHDLLKAEVLKRFDEKPTLEELNKFDKLLQRYPDGTIRNDKSTYDGTQSAGVFIPPNVKITNQLKHRVMVMTELVENYGKAFHNQFKDTYFTTSENIMVIYWPEVPNWTINMDAHFDMSKEEYVWVADKKNNPSREYAWTGVFFDKIGKTWMTSLETPVDGKDWSVTIGHDVMLDDFLARVSKDHIAGTYNMIFRKDGRVITHPELSEKIKDSEGQLTLQSSDNNYLKTIFNSITADNDVKSNSTRVLSQSDLKDLLVYSRIDGPDWYFVTAHPRSLITSSALNGIIFIIILALASLAFEIAILFYGLKRDIIEPLRKLEESVKKISKGEYPTRVEINRSDEIGQMAESFNIMAQKIFDNEKSLLEKVEERTKQINEQKSALVHNSKLASLGQMAGGIAHEINSPLAIISMRLQQMTSRMEKKEASEEYMANSIANVQKTTDRIAKIVSGLKFFARDGSNFPKQKVLFDSIVENTMSFCYEKMRQDDIKLEIIKNYSDDMTIDCRPVEVSQVLLNLLNNSHDAIGSLDNKWVRLSITDLKSSVEISVTDSGPGIPLDIQDKVMQPFFTTKDIGKGTGLGLSISHGIVEAHEGKFFIDNNSTNTKFTVIIPKECA